ncbi:MAG: lipase family protein [Myxococcales bacterium]|nr:lipase family protein [Myxococcales bacterium]
MATRDRPATSRHPHERPPQPWIRWRPRASAHARARRPKPAHDPETALLLALASTWAYSDRRGLGDVLNRTVLPGARCELIESRNSALLVDTQVFLVRQAEAGVTIVVFRGTEFGGAGISDVLTDFAIDPIPYPKDADSTVHRGFLRGLVAVWPTLLDALARHPQDRLYLTGHSLGGALAALMAVALCLPEGGGVMGTTDEAARVSARDRLVAVYTFGQPMIGSPSFARRAAVALARHVTVVRHIYNRDAIPRQPGRALGRFAHFGDEVWATEGSSGWTPTPGKAVVQDLTIAGLMAGAVDFLFRQTALTRALKLPRSLSDHVPQHYVDVCKRAVFGPRGLDAPYYP